MGSTRKMTWAWCFVAALSLNAAAQASEPALDQDRAAFLADIRSILADSDIQRGLMGDAGYEAVRKYLREGRFLRAREARILASLGASCASQGLENALQSMVRDIDGMSRSRIASHYLTTAQMSCSRRVRDDSELLADLVTALEAGKVARLEHYERFVRDERALALKEEEERRLRAMAASVPPQSGTMTESERLASAPRSEASQDEPARGSLAADAPGPAKDERAAGQPEPAPAAQQPPKKDEPLSVESKSTASPSAIARTGAHARIAGTYECGTVSEPRVLHLGYSGEIVELISVGGSVLGFAGLYRVTRDRVTARLVADNTWKVFASKYDQHLPDDVAWKRSGIATQKVLEFRFVEAGSDRLKLEAARSKLLKSGEISELKRRDCVKLKATHPVNRAVAAHVQMARPYVDKQLDAAPERLADAKLSLLREIEAKKRSELAWFTRAPGVLKMMATDRLLEELRTASDGRCAAPKAALEAAAASAMGVINRIGESEQAKANPEGAEALAGRQLDPVFEQFLDSAGRMQCIMAESSAVGL